MSLLEGLLLTSLFRASFRVFTCPVNARFQAWSFLPQAPIILDFCDMDVSC